MPKINCSEQTAEYAGLRAFFSCTSNWNLRLNEIKSVKIDMIFDHKMIIRQSVIIQQKKD